MTLWSIKTMHIPNACSYTSLDWRNFIPSKICTNQNASYILLPNMAASMKTWEAKSAQIWAYSVLDYDHILSHYCQNLSGIIRESFWCETDLHNRRLVSNKPQKAGQNVLHTRASPLLQTWNWISTFHSHCWAIFIMFIMSWCANQIICLSKQNDVTLVIVSIKWRTSTEVQNDE
jgi:hypothetical protein